MKAVGYNKSLPIDQENALFDFEAERPKPGKNDLLVRVFAAYSAGFFQCAISSVPCWPWGNL